MSTKMCRVSNHERRPVIIRGCSGASYHLAALETGREIRALELEGNSMVEKLKRRNVLGVEEISTRSKRKPRSRKRAKPKASRTKNAGQKSSPGKADKSGSSVIE